MTTTKQKKQPQEIAGAPDSPFREILERLKIIAETDDSVLFIGETGVGKEVLFKELLEYSKQEDNYKAINCSGFPKDLIGSELFGHVEGAFTDAKKDRAGLIMASNNGILFLDELGDMNQNDQANLLRIIEDKKVRKIGSDESGEEVKVRFIAATNKEEKIRKDLKARFKHWITIKPLRDRPFDIPYLLQHFLDKIDPSFKGIEVEALCCLLFFEWKENVRQLKNILDAAKIERQFWKSKNENDPSNEILCGFHLPDEVTAKYRATFKKFKEYDNYVEVTKKKFIKVFNSNIAASYWLDWADGHPVWVSRLSVSFTYPPRTIYIVC